MAGNNLPDIEELLNDVRAMARGESDSVANADQILMNVRSVRLRCWRQVSSGDTRFPAQIRASLAPLRPILMRAAIPHDPPAIQVMRSMSALLDELDLATHAIGHRAAPGEVRRSTRPPRETEVLRVLLAAHQRDPVRPLGRADVVREMSEALRPEPQRVGQILASLYERGLLHRELRTTQGAHEGAFYRLNADGLEAASLLGLQHEVRLEFGQRRSSLPLADVAARGRRGAPRPGAFRNVVVFHSPGLTLLPARRLWEFARRSAYVGESVLVIDLDLVHGAWERELPDPSETERGGAADWVLDMAASVSPGHAALLGQTCRPFANLPTLEFVPTGLYGQSRGGSAQRRHAALRALVESARTDGALISRLRETLNNRPGLVLVNAGCANTELAVALTTRLADAVVLSFAPDRSELETAAIVQRDIAEWHGTKPDDAWVPVLPVVLTTGAMPTDAEVTVPRHVPAASRPPLNLPFFESDDPWRFMLLPLDEDHRSTVDPDGRWAREVSTNDELAAFHTQLLLALRWWSSLPDASWVHQYDERQRWRGLVDELLQPGIDEIRLDDILMCLNQLQYPCQGLYLAALLGQRWDLLEARMAPMVERILRNLHVMLLAEHWGWQPPGVRPTETPRGSRMEFPPTPGPESRG